jgi:very-short-patch-repair endonuclease
MRHRLGQDKHATRPTASQKLRLVIEVDGDSHREEFRSAQPHQEDLEKLGLHVLRFQDRDVKH